MDSIDGLIKDSQDALAEHFSCVDEICDFNQEKVLNAFRKNKIGEEHFYTVTGYGHDDIGREALDRVFADVFKAEKAIVRPHFVSGTHTLACCLFGILRMQDVLLSVTGRPYDTMQQVIGINHRTPESLWGHGVEYREVPFINDKEVDYGEIYRKVDDRTKMVLIQRSRGYSLRKSLSVDEIRRIVEIVKSKNPNCICFVDNCYGEFVEDKEPIEVGADLMAGSLIKNPGGGIVEAGGYIAGRADLVDLCSARLTAPGIYSQGGAMFNQTRIMLQGLFMAPLIVSQALKGALLCAKVFENIGLKTTPRSREKRSDLIQTVEFKNPEDQSAFCRAVQMYSPVDSYLTPIPDEVPGYDDKLIMAGGTFVEGSTIELSADGPVRPPYVVYMQGGLSYSHVKIVLKGILNEIENAKLSK
ncbi:MAG: aluminum resistance family protein [Cyanobacteria bacterium SIG30]|nr:aluminum resistance family protein [Cyanobacteria bacterium SIG30]